MSERLPVPAYLPPLALPLVPWARRHVRRVMHVYQLGPDDLWDETITALIRAVLYFDPSHDRTFRHYAQRAVNRACWRYVVRGLAHQPARVHRVGEPPWFHGGGVDPRLVAPSIEDELCAREAVQAFVPAATRPRATRRAG